MIARLLSLLAIVALFAVIGCKGRDPVIAIAESDFARQNPEIEVVETGIRKRDATGVVVYVRFVRTPAIAFPPKASIWERELVYASNNAGWQCVESRGDNYIRPAR